MPKTLLDGESYESALHRRMQEEAAEIEDDGLWPCMNWRCDNRVEADGDYCPDCKSEIEYYQQDQAEDWEFRPTHRESTGGQP